MHTTATGPRDSSAGEAAYLSRRVLAYFHLNLGHTIREKLRPNCMQSPAFCYKSVIPEIRAIRRHYAALGGSSVPTFRDNLSVTSTA